MRQRLGLTAEKEDDRRGSVFQALKGEDTTLIQRENSSLAKNVCCQKSHSKLYAYSHSGIVS